MNEAASGLRPDVTVVIVSFRTRELTIECLRSLFASTRRARLEVVVVDNASGDGTPNAVSECFPNVQVIAMPVNVGFGAAVNLGARGARGEYLLLLNPDVTVHEGAVDEIVDFARARPVHGLYGGQTLGPEGNVDPRSVWGRPTRWSQLCWAMGLSALFSRSRVFDPESLGVWARDSVREVPVVIGALLLVHMDAWRRLGGFDERFFMYSEDTDLSLRAWQLGYRPVMTPDARITHLLGRSTSSKPDRTVMLLRGRVTLLRKHWDPASFAAGRLAVVAGVALRAAGELLRERSGQRVERHWVPVLACRRTWASGWPQ